VLHGVTEGQGSAHTTRRAVRVFKARILLLQLLEALVSRVPLGIRGTG
jgi:hypothetical protein